MQSFLLGGGNKQTRHLLGAYPRTHLSEYILETPFAEITAACFWGMPLNQHILGNFCIYVFAIILDRDNFQISLQILTWIWAWDFTGSF